jgi:hypothetical protein
LVEQNIVALNQANADALAGRRQARLELKLLARALR